MATATHLIQKMENVLLVMYIHTIALLYLGPMLVKEIGENNVQLSLYYLPTLSLVLSSPHTAHTKFTKQVFKSTFLIINWRQISLEENFLLFSATSYSVVVSMQ